MSCDPLMIGLLFLTLHVPDAQEERRFETLTPGAYIRYEAGPIDPTGGIFRNSEGGMSLFAAGTIEDCTDDNPFFLTLGLATGYDAGPVVPLMSLGVKLDALPFAPKDMPRLRLGLTPVIEGRGNSRELTGVGITLSWEF